MASCMARPAETFPPPELMWRRMGVSHSTAAEEAEEAKMAAARLGLLVPLEELNLSDSSFAKAANAATVGKPKPRCQ